MTRREEIFGIARDMFITYGYHATSITDISIACNLHKASLYHHIDNKQAMLMEIIKTDVDKCNKIIFAPGLAGDSDKFIQALRDNMDLLSISFLTHEMISSVKPAAKLLKVGYYDLFISALTMLIGKNKNGYRVAEIAESLLAELQGGLIIHCVAGNDDWQKAFFQRLRNSIV